MDTPVAKRQSRVDAAAKQRRQFFAYRSFWPELETMKRFRECGIDTFAYLVSHTVNSLGLPYTKYPPVWKWNQLYDLNAFDRQTDDILEAVPDARLICMLDLNTPQWWTRYLGAYGVRYDSYYELGKISPSRTWRVDTAEYMQTVMRHAEARYGDRIAAYVLCCGGAHEWHDRSRGEESVYRLAAYRRWQQEHGRPPTDIPGRMLRDVGSHDFDPASEAKLSYFNGIDPTGCYGELFPSGYGLFRTPEENAEAIDYWRFVNEQNLEAATFMAREARQAIRPEAELGMFFGYIFSGQWSQTSNGHLEYERLADLPEVDFLISPISYGGRQMGAAAGERVVNRTMWRRGKRVLNEMDQRTFTTNHRLSDYVELPDPLKAAAEEVTWDDPTSSREMAKKFAMATFGIWKNEDEVVAGMKRDAAFSLIRGSSLWWFDMWGGFYQGDHVYETLALLKKIWDEQADDAGGSAAEVLLVVDPANAYYLNDKDARVGTFNSQTRDALTTVPAPHDIASFNDLDEIDLHQYRLVVLCHPFELTERHQRILRERVCRGDRHVVWIYGPGIIHDGRWDEQNVQRVCGTPFGTPGISTVVMDGWTSVYAHQPATLTPEALRGLAADAGCHLYFDQLRPVCVSERLVAVHTGEAESLRVRLPRVVARVTELFTGQSWERTDQVLLTTSGPDSFLLRLDDSDD